MAKSTFAGKSTDDTIRNYAEMLIDDLNSNLPDNASKHWDKAREIDNQIAKEIFGGEYSDRIGEAYNNCLVNFKHGELTALWDKYWGDGEAMLLTTRDAILQSCVDHFFETMKIAAVASVICPQSADIHASAALIGITHLIGGSDYQREKAVSKFKEEHPNEDFPVDQSIFFTLKSNKHLGEYNEAKPIVENHIASALGIQPQHPRALEAKKLLEEVDNWQPSAPAASGCFIATAAYGTPFAEEIDVLRNWRDEFLEASYPGRLFIKTYYSLSPPVADNISESDSKRKIVRTALGPIVKVLKDKYSN